MRDVLIELIDERFAVGIFGRVFGKDFANLLQRVAGDAVGGELAQQIASKFVLTCLRAKLNLFKDQLRTELTKVADVLLPGSILKQSLERSCARIGHQQKSRSENGSEEGDRPTYSLQSSFFRRVTRPTGRFYRPASATTDAEPLRRPKCGRHQPEAQAEGIFTSSSVVR